MIFEIKGTLPGLNDYTKVNRGNRYAANNLKQTVENNIIWCVKEQLPMIKIKKPCVVHFTWYEPSTRRDCDNVAFAKKFILDAMVKSKLIVDDNQKYIKGFTDTFKVDKDNPRIKIEIYEIKEKNYE